jgi:hypothetical protein
MARRLPSKLRFEVATMMFLREEAFTVACKAGFPRVQLLEILSRFLSDRKCYDWSKPSYPIIRVELTCSGPVKVSIGFTTTDPTLRDWPTTLPRTGHGLY